MSAFPRVLALLHSFVLLTGCTERPPESGSSTTEGSSATAVTSQAEQTVEVEVYTDLVCPWCFIAMERLDQVLAARTGGPRIVVRHRSFLLDPNTPPEGIDVEKKLQARFGKDPSELFARVEAVAKASGIELDLSKQPRQHSTVAAHALLRNAETKGSQRALERAMFRAHFHDSQNLSDPAVLSALAEQHGFTPEEVSRIVGDPTEHAAVQAEARAATERGVRGVPYFIFEGGRKLSGAQSAEVLRRAIDEARPRAR